LASQLGLSYAKRVADARRSDAELKALLARKADEAQRDAYLVWFYEPRPVSLSHWGMH
jgi:hypothetical protein